MEVDPAAPQFKRSKSRKSMNDVGAAADGNKFSTLPESVVHLIFSFLGTIDVIRASAVSRDWRYLWTSMPHLDFNYECPQFYEYDKFKDFINWVLMTHDKSLSIKSCRLSCLNNEDDYSAYRWLHILVQKNVQELYLTFDSESDNEIPFALPRCLFASGSLEVLELDLWGSVLEIPNYSGFRLLKSLQLVSTLLLDQNLFQNFISSCPLLEILSLKECEFHDFKVLDISARNLRELVIEMAKYVEGLSKCDLKITCPNLVYFDLTGPLVQSLSWGENPHFLQTVILYPFWDVDDQVLNDKITNFLLEFLREVCHVKFLKLRINILECISSTVAKPWCFSTIFYNLKTLALCTGREACHTQSIIYLLKRAPNLQLLSVYIDYYKDFDRDFKCKMLEEDIECLTCHLKMVKLIDINGSDAELELIRFFLKNAHMLEKMSIIWCHSVDQKTQSEVIQKLMKFPRSSSHVNVTFSEPK